MFSVFNLISINYILEIKFPKLKNLEIFLASTRGNICALAASQ